MKLYLIQHGDAVDKSIDPDRPLSESGRTDIKALARWLAGHGIQVEDCRHSGKTRALQTAQILAAGSGASVESVEGIGPNDDPRSFADVVAGHDHDTAVVSHLPFVARLASTLLAGEADALVLAFVPGSVACLERGDSGWSLCWMVRPQQYGECDGQ